MFLIKGHNLYIVVILLFVLIVALFSFSQQYTAQGLPKDYFIGNVINALFGRITDLTGKVVSVVSQHRTKGLVAARVNKNKPLVQRVSSNPRAVVMTHVLPPVYGSADSQGAPLSGTWTSDHVCEQEVQQCTDACGNPVGSAEEQAQSSDALCLEECEKAFTDCMAQ